MALYALVKTPGLSIGWDVDPVDVSGGRRVLQKRMSDNQIGWFAGKPASATHRVLTRNSSNGAVGWRVSDDLTWVL